MDKPMFYFGSAYLITLMVLSLTGVGMAIGMLTVAGAACIALLVIIRRPGQGKRKLKFFLAAGAVVIVGCIAFLLQTKLVYEPALTHAEEELEGTFVVSEVLSDSSTGAHRCVLLVEGREPVRKLRFSSSDYRPEVGAVFQGTLQLKALGEQDPAVARYYRSRGLYLAAVTDGRVDGEPMTESARRGGFSVSPIRLAYWSLRIHLNDLRSTFISSIEDRLPEEEAGVLVGMLVGDQSGIDSDTNESFRRAGVQHLFAVSGFHVSLWTMLLYRMFLHLGAGRKTSTGGALLFLFLFVALTGFPRSAVRAGLMLGIFFLSRMFVQSTDPLNALGVAVLCLVLPNPFYAADTGILLSYSATLGILSWYPPLSKQLREFLMQRIPNYKLRKRVEAPLGILLVSLSSFVFTLPVVLLTFENVSLMTLLSNLLVSSASSLAILMTGLGAVLSPLPLLSLLSPWCFLLAGLLARFMLSVCTTLGSLPFAYLSLVGPGFGLGFVGALLVAICGFVLYGSLQEQSLVRLTALLSVVLLLGSVFTDTALNRNVVQIFFPDVPGSCTVVVYRHAAAIIGTGSDAYSTEQSLQELFQREGVTEVTNLVLPRTTKTESGAADVVRNRYTPTYELAPEQFAGPARQTIHLWPEIDLELYLQDGEYPAALLRVCGVRTLLLFRPTVQVENLPVEAATAPVCYLRGKRLQSLKLPSSSYIIVSGESGEVEMRVSNNRFQLYRW